MTTHPLPDQLTVEDITVVKVHQEDIKPSIFEYIDSGGKNLTDKRRKEKPVDPPEAWPKQVWVVEYSSGEHGVMRINDLHGLVAFRKKDQAVSFTKYVLNPPSRVWKAVKMSFDDARELAKSKPNPISALILSGDSPLVHYVK